MRLFVAAVPPQAALRELEARAAPLRELAGGPRWVPAERWHVTLAFLGEVGAGRVDDLVAGLGEVAAGAAAFPLAISGAGTFPERGTPRVLWVGLSGEVAALHALARRTRAAARRSRIALDRKPFRAHLTLGRWRQGDRADRTVAERLAGYQGSGFELSEIALVQSFLGPSPRYETVRNWRLPHQA